MTYLIPYVGAERRRERPKPEKKKPPPENAHAKVMKEVCKKYRVTLAQVRSREFHPTLMLARRECVARLRDELGLSWREIGRHVWRDRKACRCLWERVNDSLSGF